MKSRRDRPAGDSNGTESLAQQLRVRVEQQAVIADLGLMALAGTALQELMDSAVRRIADTLAVEYCKILELLPNGKALLLRAGVGWHKGLVGSATVGTDLDSQAGYTLRSKEPIIVEDLRTESRFRGPPLLVEHGVISGMSVIIHGSAGPYGVLGTHTTRRHLFEPDDIHFIQGMANVIAEAVERQRREEAVRRANDELEKRVEQRTAELRSVVRELESFSYAVSHDLRAPLRGIGGFARALLEDFGPELDDTARHYIDRIVSASQRMSDLIDDLLGLSRLGEGALNAEPVDLGEIAKSAVDELRASEEGRDVTFEISGDPRAHGDRRLLGIVLGNLLHNAWKFTRGSDPSRISVGSEEHDGKKSYYVRDDGVGFDMRYASRLFVPFQRLHSEEVEGTGIGLATVNRIVRRHGGRMWAEGREGSGSTFYFTLGPGDEDSAEER